MFTCDVCGGYESHVEMVAEVFDIDGRRVLVENIPARVCARCGEVSFSREIAERVRRMVHGEAQPVGVVELEVFDFA